MQQCSFCKKSQNRVSCLITEAGAAICNECIDKYIDILKEKGVDLLKKRTKPKFSILPKKAKAYCSFCGRPNYLVEKVIKGPNVNICNECIEICLDYFEQEGLNLLAQRTDKVAETRTTIIRVVTLPPEYYEAGLSLLAYFAVILSYRYPSFPIKTHLELDHHTIRLVLNFQEEAQEKIQQLLEEYGLVIQGKCLPQQLLAQDEQCRELYQRLHMTALFLQQFKKEQDVNATVHQQESIEEKAMKLHNALGWIFRREIEDVEDLFM